MSENLFVDLLKALEDEFMDASRENLRLAKCKASSGNEKKHLAISHTWQLAAKEITRVRHKICGK